MREDHTPDGFDHFENTGRIWLRGALSGPELVPLDQACDLGTQAGERLGKDAIAPTLAKLTSLLAPFSKTPLRPVRIVAFNKSSGANWGVPWHQDRVIAVKARPEVDGFFNWSQKAGVWHCEPPLALLEQVLFVRVHLDNTTTESGAMEIAVGSHKAGKVTTAEAAKLAEGYRLESCTAKRGDVLVLKMLTLHRSGPAEVATNRREVRIDFAGFALPTPLEWAK